MKTSGLLNTSLLTHVSRLGHTDVFAIGDRGLPVPAGVPLVDLALVEGVPTFAQVLDAVLAEVTVEHSLHAAEAAEGPAGRWIIDRLPRSEAVPHEELKRQLTDSRFVVRTGESTPFANVVLRSGVPF